VINVKSKKRLTLIAVIILVGVTGGFVISDTINSKNRIILATTTSTYDSGLLDYLLPTFEEETGIIVEVLSVGTGQALATGESGDCDVILVHARDRENTFIQNNYGVHRTCVMYNDFVIVGPISDPANISGDSVEDAMLKLKLAGEAESSKFYSRGDNSGTHSKELALWQLIGFTPDAATDTWYIETGAGMGTTLTIADEREVYTLVDRGTWLAMKDDVTLEIMVEGDEVLLNPYGAILINPELHNHVKIERAREFVAFLVSEEGQTLIANFRKNGEVLFYPAFGVCDDTHSCNTTSTEVAYWSQYNGGYTGPSAAPSSPSPASITSSNWGYIHA
jgi:tungstate transport system substrate-binding protein